MSTATIISGRCLSYGEGITYWPVVEAVKQLLGDEPAPNAAIAALLGDGDAAAEDIAFAVRRLFESSARERPLVVYFDDLQWAEPTFLDLIEHVTDWSRDAPMLVLCSARPDLLELRPAWGGGKLNATTVLLEPSDRARDGRADRALARLGRAVRGMRERIADAAEGNPLFVEQMLAMVQDSRDEEVAVPPTIQALLAARLDQLPTGERLALERGAVEGQVFHRGAVQALAPDDAVDPGAADGARAQGARPADRPRRCRRTMRSGSGTSSFATPPTTHCRRRRAPSSTSASRVWLEEHGSALVELDEILGYHLEQAARYRAELGTGAGRSRRPRRTHLTAMPAGARCSAATSPRAAHCSPAPSSCSTRARRNGRGVAVARHRAVLPRRVRRGRSRADGGRRARGRRGRGDRVLRRARSAAATTRSRVRRSPASSKGFASGLPSSRRRLAARSYAEGYHALARLRLLARADRRAAARPRRCARDYARQAGVECWKACAPAWSAPRSCTANPAGTSTRRSREACWLSATGSGASSDNALSGLAVAASCSGTRTRNPSSSSPTTRPL